MTESIKNRSLTEQANMLDGMKSRLTGMVNKLDSRIAQAQNTQRDAAKADSNLILKLYELEKDKDRLTEEVQSLKVLLEQQTNTNTARSSRMSRKTSLKPIPKKETKGLKNESKDKKIQSLQQEVISLSQKLNKKKFKIQQLKKELNGAKHSNALTIKNLQEQINKLTDDNMSHQQKIMILDKVREDKEIQELNLSKANRENDMLLTEIKFKEKVIEELESKANAIEEKFIRSSISPSQENDLTLHKLQSVVHKIYQNPMLRSNKSYPNVDTMENCIKALQALPVLQDQNIGTCYNTFSPKNKADLANLKQPKITVQEKYHPSIETNIDFNKSEFEKLTLELTSKVTYLENELKSIENLEKTTPLNRDDIPQKGKLYKNVGKPKYRK